RRAHLRNRRHLRARSRTARMQRGRPGDDQGHRRLRCIHGIDLQLAATGRGSAARPQSLRGGARAPDARGNDRGRASGRPMGDPMKGCARTVLASLAFALCATTAQAATPTQNADLDRLVDAVVAYYHLPGIAVGVINDGKVVYTHESGMLASGKPIDANTLFEIASNSKAMTSTLLARLVQQGKLRWNDPVTKYIPSFRMHDPWVTQNMQVGDLLVHHSGLPEGAGDLMLWPTPNHFTPADVTAGLRYLKPAYSFRAGYAYDNTLYIVAGQDRKSTRL